MFEGRRKVKDERVTSLIAWYRPGRTEYYRDRVIRYEGTLGYHYSLSDFLNVLRRERANKNIVIFRETIGWKPRVKFSWDKPQSFSPTETADYIEKRNLLTDHWAHFESRWQVISGRGHEQHYFDIDIYHTDFPRGYLEIGRLTKGDRFPKPLRGEVAVVLLRLVFE
mgnify:CR=1 FL=1